jgi:UDP-2,4-diacetamido-2,4,6-trideoxy-beta-L-altropyranose hydrolase
MRCLTLADALTRCGWTCSFACNQEAPRTVPALRDSGHVVNELLPEEACDPAAVRRTNGAGVDLLVIDSYGLDATYESGCRPWARRILVIDDLADRPHDADLLLDQTLGRSESAYRKLVPERCSLLLGTPYALLRPQFAKAREHVLQNRRNRRGVGRILISLGATDPDNVTGKVVAAIASQDRAVKVNVIVGASSAHVVPLERLVKSLPTGSTMTVNPSVDAMIDLVGNADLAIGAGGVSAWERCCLGLPSLLLVLADNQKDNVQALVNAGAACGVTADGNDLDCAGVAVALETIQQDADRLAEMSSAAARVCDGRGAERVVEALLRPNGP